MYPKGVTAKNQFTIIIDENVTRVILIYLTRQIEITYFNLTEIPPSLTYDTHKNFIQVRLISSIQNF